MAKLFLDDEIIVSLQEFYAICDRAMETVNDYCNEPDAQFWFCWGNEPDGFVSIGKYDTNDVYVSLGYSLKETVKNMQLPYLCPFN